MKKSTSILVAIAICFVLGAAGTAAAQNVIVNPNFAGSLASWTTGANGSFNAADCCGDTPVGSAAGATGASNGIKNVVTQCVVYNATVNPSFGMGGRISVTDASGAAGASRATITATFFPAAACGGASLGAFVVGLAPVVAATPFTLFALTAQTTPATALSALISLDVRRDNNVGSIGANFDHIFLGAGLTTPVSLQHFHAD